MKKGQTLLFFLLFLFTFLYVNTLLAQTTYTTTIIESKKAIHPRLYLDQAGINQLKTQIISGKYLTLYNRLITAVNRYPTAPTTAVATGTDLRAWGDRLLNLSIAYKLSGNSAYLSKAESYATYLMTAPDSYYSNPALEPGHHLSGLSVFYDWCFNEMNSTVKSNLITFVNTKGNLFNTWLNSSVADTKFYSSNQLTSRISGLGSAALAFYECFDTKGWISTAMQKFIFAESVRGDDGGFVEAASYGGYDLDFQMRFFDLAKVLLSCDFYNSIWWSNCANYQVYMTLPYNSWSSKLNVVDIGDSPRYLWYGPDYMLRGIAKVKKNGYAQQLADMAETKVINNDVALALNLLRYDGTVSSTSLANLPLLHHFDNYGVVTTRDSWSNNKSLVSFTCGPALGLQFVQNNTFDAGTGHSHPNANSFSIFSNGEFLIRNPGYVLRRTDQENTLLVDTYGQLDQPITQNYWVSTAQASAKLYPTMIKVESNPDFDIMVGDATKSYSAVNKYERTLIYMKPNVVLVLDNIQSAANHNFELFFHAEQMMDSVVNINNTYKVKGDFTDMVINPLTTIGVTIDAKNKSVLTRDQTSIAYTNFVVDLKKTTNTWMNAIAFSWNDKNLTPTDVSIVSKNGNVWIFNIGGKLLTYDWINRNATLNTTATLNTVATNLQGISNPIPFVRVLSSGQKQIDLLIDNKIEPGATACLYSSNGICMKRTNIVYEKTQIQLDDCYRGLYLLNVINGIQSKTYKIIL